MASATVETKGDVRYETRDGIAFLTLDAPPLNVLSVALMHSLTAAIERAVADASLKAIAITASGRAFSAGADIGEHSPELAGDMIQAFSALFGALGACELPIVMAVDGPALGAGFELAIMADILLASERATFGQPEIRLGFFAPVGVSWLPARIGVARALEVTCTGRIYSASEMASMSLVSRVVATDELYGALESVLADLRRASPAVMRMNVRLTRRLHGRSFDEARREAERVFMHGLMPMEDVREGIAAFFEKRKPEWKGR